MLFWTLALYLLGGTLYLLIIVLIFYRLTFFEVSAEALTPSYWITMGAAAITTLAGATLVLRVADSTLLQAVRPFLVGSTLFFWITGTGWIPLLVALGVWRHLWKRVPLRYAAEYWSLVFPLGMYTACTFQLVRATHLEFLELIPRRFLYAALAVWLATFLGLIRELVSVLVLEPLAMR